MVISLNFPALDSHSRSPRPEVLLYARRRAWRGQMARIWKIVRHGAPDQWEDSIPEESLAEGQLVVLLSRLAASHLPPVATTPLPRNAPRYTTSLTVKNDRLGMHLIMYASGSRVYYIATLEETPGTPRGPRGKKRPRRDRQRSSYEADRNR